MSQMIPFESNSKLPSFIQAAAATGVGSLANLGTSLGFPVMSIKSKVFTLKRGDEKTLVTKPGEDDPASSIEVVIIGVGPNGNNNAKVWYDKGFTEGDDAKPVCYSNDGISPASDSESPQAKKCAVCPRNQFGSRITEAGKNAKECQDAKRLAIAAVGQINDPMLLRVPATSLKALRELNSTLSKRGVTETFQVVVKIGFDYTVSHPALTFKPVGFVDEKTYFEAKQESTGDTVALITGAKTFEGGAPADDALADKPAFMKESEPEEKPVTKPKAAAKPKPEAEDDLPTEPPKSRVKVEEEALAEKPKAAAAKPKVVEEVEEAGDDLDAALDLDFDDE